MAEAFMQTRSVTFNPLFREAERDTDLHLDELEMLLSGRGCLCPEHEHWRGPVTPEMVEEALRLVRLISSQRVRWFG